MAAIMTMTINSPVIGAQTHQRIGDCLHEVAPLPSASSKTISKYQTTLPDDAVPLISYFLTVTESLHAIYVCKSWADQFGQNTAWKWRANRLGISASSKDN